MPHSQFAAKTDLPLSEDEQYLNRRVSQFVICECESSQMEEGIGFAEVIDSEQLPKLINEVDVFKVRAKMCGPEHDYSNDTFFVKILNSAPEFIEMKSRRMVHGQFDFLSLKQLKPEERLKILIMPIPPGA